MKKTILSACVFIAMISCVLVSCSQYEEPYDLLLLEEQSKQEITLNKETSSFKADVISVVSQTKTRASGDDFSFSAEQIKMLRKSSLEMFQSHGFSEKEVLILLFTVSSVCSHITEKIWYSRGKTWKMLKLHTISW